MRLLPWFLLSVPAVLAAQAPLADGGRLDPAWFGPQARLLPSKALGFQWVKPGLDLRNRSLCLKPWEPAVWLRWRPAVKDQQLLGRLEPLLLPGLEAGLRRGLGGAVPVSASSGDALLVGRVVDAEGVAEDGIFAGAARFTFDLRLVDGDTGEVLAGFHDTLKGLDADLLAREFAQWSEQLGRLLGGAAAPPAAPASGTSRAPAFDLAGALRRIEALRRDGLLSEAEGEALRKKAEAKAK